MDSNMLSWFAEVSYELSMVNQPVVIPSDYLSEDAIVKLVHPFVLGHGIFK